MGYPAPEFRTSLSLRLDWPQSADFSLFALQDVTATDHLPPAPRCLGPAAPHISFFSPFIPLYFI